MNWNASFSILQSPGVLSYIGKGILFTLVISVLSVAVSIFLGSVLALCRNYCKGKSGFFRVISTVYIEIFRNTPLLLWIFICLVACPCPKFFARKMWGLTSVEMKILFRGVVALVLFESSIIAEIIRGGLNAIPKGQFEAAHTQGFSTVQTMVYIILPQAFRAVVPTLLGQVISTIKDSSYLANLACIELMSRVRKILATSNMFNGVGRQMVSDVFVLFGLAFAIYFAIDFTLSCVVRALRNRKPRQLPAKKEAAV